MAFASRVSIWKISVLSRNRNVGRYTPFGSMKFSEMVALMNTSRGCFLLVQCFAFQPICFDLIKHMSSMLTYFRWTKITKSSLKFLPVKGMGVFFFLDKGHDSLRGRMSAI